MSIEAMKQALQALELCNGAETADGIVIYTDKEITSLRQAIAEAEKQEPVAWMHKQGNYEEPSFRQLDDDEISRAWEQYPLYTHPQPATQCEFIRHTKEGTHWCALAQKQAEWVGLTDEEKTSICKVGPVYAPDGVVTRRPIEYRSELEGVAWTAICEAEAKLKQKIGRAHV